MSQDANSVIDRDRSEIEVYMFELGRRAVDASRLLARADTALKNRGLMAIADRLDAAVDHLLAQNKLDLEAAVARNIDSALLDRLELTPGRIGAMADGIRQIVQLPDPVGDMSNMRNQPSGLQIGKMRVPLGVIGMIYESRPNVTADAAALCIKSGNAVILRGGSEAFRSNKAIAECIKAGLSDAGLTTDAAQLVDTTDRDAVGHMLNMNEHITVIIPRGGKSLVKRISENATVPVIKHLEGNCHVYIDSEADAEKAVAIAVNSKTYRYGICGAMETLLIHSSAAGALLPEINNQLQMHNVEIRGCEKTCAQLKNAKPATSEDWYTEYLAPILSIRVVEDLASAVAHIANYGSSHTDAIVTENLTNAKEFVQSVDSSSVMVNAATCFADGFQYGLGAEIGISTDKLHVRGPVGLEGLTSEKYVVYGDGTTRS